MRTRVKCIWRQAIPTCLQTVHWDFINLLERFGPVYVRLRRLHSYKIRNYYRLAFRGGSSSHLWDLPIFVFYASGPTVYSGLRTTRSQQKPHIKRCYYNILLKKVFSLILNRTFVYSNLLQTKYLPFGFGYHCDHLVSLDSVVIYGSWLFVSQEQDKFVLKFVMIYHKVQEILIHVINAPAHWFAFRA